MTATGTANLYLPPGSERDEILGLIRLGASFKNQQHLGRKRGVLFDLVLDCARRGGPPYSFAQLLDELELAAARRELHGERASPVEYVNRHWHLATIHLPKKGEVKIAFWTLRGHLTNAKKKLKNEIVG